MDLRAWSDKQLKEVTEDGTCAVLIRLSTDDAVWETWQRPFPEVETFVAEANAVIDQLKSECPVRRVRIMFTAESASGTVLSQHPTSVQGTNKNADALAGSGNNAAKAFAEAMEGISRVVVATLKSAEVQVGSLTKTLENQANQIHELIEYHRVKQEVEMMETKAENNDVQALVLAQLKEVLPMLPAAFDLWQQSQKAELAKAATKVAAKVVTAAVTKTPSNGAIT